MYIRKFPTKAASYLNRLTFEKWGLKSVSVLQPLLKNIAPKFTGTAEGVWKAESNKGYLNLKLYDDRTVVMNEKSFLSHTRNNRLKLWSALKETLLDPDEIWLNDFTSDAFDNINLVKYYKDIAINAAYKIEGGQLTLKTWYDIYPRRSVWRKIRRGLLIKRQGS
jgi:hypothetical protein